MLGGLSVGLADEMCDDLCMERLRPLQDSLQQSSPNGTGLLGGDRASRWSYSNPVPTACLTECRCADVSWSWGEASPAIPEKVPFKSFGTKDDESLSFAILDGILGSDEDIASILRELENNQGEVINGAGDEAGIGSYAHVPVTTARLIRSLVYPHCKPQPHVLNASDEKLVLYKGHLLGTSRNKLVSFSSGTGTFVVYDKWTSTTHYVEIKPNRFVTMNNLRFIHGVIPDQNDRRRSRLGPFSLSVEIEQGETDWEIFVNLHLGIQRRRCLFFRLISIATSSKKGKGSNQGKKGKANTEHKGGKKGKNGKEKANKGKGEGEKKAVLQAQGVGTDFTVAEPQNFRASKFHTPLWLWGRATILLMVCLYFVIMIWRICKIRCVASTSPNLSQLIRSEVKHPRVPDYSLLERQP
eukprot:g62424.t1